MVESIKIARDRNVLKMLRCSPFRAFVLAVRLCK